MTKPNSPERQRQPRSPEARSPLDLRQESSRRVDDIQYESMRRRFVREARDSMDQRRARETPITPWQRGRDYEWLRMQNGTAYAVYDNGEIKVSFSGNRRPINIRVGMCPPAVQQKHMELTVAVASSRSPREVRETGLQWTTKIQQRTNERYDYTSLPDGTKYAVYHRGGRIQRFTQREGVRTISSSVAPAFIRERAALYLGSAPRGSALTPRQQQPVRERPATATPEPSAPPEVAPSRSRVPENSSMTPAEFIQELRAIRITDATGKEIPIKYPTLSPTLLQRYSIPASRIDEYLRNVKNAAVNMQMHTGTRVRSDASNEIGFDGMYFRLNVRGKNVAIATPRHIIGYDERGQMISLLNRQKITFDSHQGTGRKVQIGNITETYTADGSIAVRQHGAVTEYYNGDDQNRPATLYLASDSQVMMSEDGSTRTHNLRSGIYYVPERGAPIGRFQNGRNFRSETERARYVMTQEDVNRAKKYVDDVVTRLKTPQAISAFVTSNFDFVSRGGLHGGAIHAEKEAPGEQDARHPLRTVFLGTGDCEDYAILLQYMCARARQLDPEAGASSFIAKTYETHNAAYYMEEYTTPSGGKAYALCKMHIHGFERITSDTNGRPFRTPEDAMRAIWKSPNGTRNGVQAEIRDIRSQIDRGEINPATVQNYLRSLEQIERNGGGLILLNKDLSNINDTSVQEGAAPYDADFSAFIRR